MTMQACDFAQATGTSAGTVNTRAMSASQIVSCPLPHLAIGDRLLVRALALVASQQIVAIHGIQHIRVAMDPFILVANHSTRRESLLVPALLFVHRNGRLVHFLADWNFRLIPGIGLIYARAKVITITRKSAKPRFLNVLKPFYRHARATLERARGDLTAGRAIGIFPEGEVNRDPTRLLPGRRGAARLSLETGAPVVPMGIRFTQAASERPTSVAAMELHIGTPLLPPGVHRQPAPIDAVTAWHAVIMSEIARLSGKTWLARKKEVDNVR